MEGIYICFRKIIGTLKKAAGPNDTPGTIIGAMNFIKRKIYIKCACHAVKNLFDFNRYEFLDF